MERYRILSVLLLAVLMFGVAWLAWSAEWSPPDEEESPAGLEPMAMQQPNGMEPHAAIDPAVAEVPEPLARLPELPRSSAVDGPRGIADLPAEHAQNVAKVNRVLGKAGRSPIEPDARIAPEDLARLTVMIEACEREIRVAAQAVLDFQKPTAREMAKAIVAAGEAGKPIPYEVLPNGVLPHREKYDLFVTSAYKGVVYLATTPMTNEAMDLVDAQHRAEQRRLDSYTTFAADVRSRSKQ